MVDYLDGHGAGLSRTVAAGGVGMLAERAALLDLPPSGRISCGGATRLVECADGWIAVSLARPDDIAVDPGVAGRAGRRRRRSLVGRRARRSP